MRVEINFGGDSHDAVISSEEIVKALRGVFRAGAETGQVLDEVKISAGQAAETSASARRMAQSVEQIGQEARRSRRELEQLRVAQAGVGGGFGGLLPGGARPRTAALGLLGLLGAGGSGPIAAGAGAAGLGALAFGGTSAGAIGVLIAAFHGLGKAIQGDRQEFEALDPAAQKLVQTLRSLAPWAEKLQQIARQGLFPGVEAGLQAALNPRTAAATEGAVRSLSGALGELAREAGEGLGGPQFQRFLADLGTHGVTQIENAGDAAGHFASSLLTLTHAGQPLADWLTRVTDAGARYVDETLQAQEATGGLSRFMHGAQDELVIVGRFVGALADAAAQLSIDLTPLGNEILGDLTVALHHLADWLKENRTQVAAFTTGALHALVDTLKVAWPIAEHLARSLSEIAHAVGGWETAFAIVIGGGLALKFTKLAFSIGAAETATEGLAAAALGLGAPEVLSAIALFLAAFDVAKHGKNSLLSHGINSLLNRAGVGGDPTSSPTYQQWQNSKGSARAAIESVMRSQGITDPKKLPGGPSFSSAGAVAHLTAGVGMAYPLGSKGKIIGTPGVGTHSFTAGPNNWESDNAIDIAVKVGTPVVAVEDGTIGSQIGSLNSSDPRMQGLRLHLLGKSGNEYYYAHLSSLNVMAGQKVKKGDVLGYSGSANGVAHLHFATKSGSPMSLVGAQVAKTGAYAAGGPTDTGGKSGSSPFGTPPPFGDDKGANILPAALRLAIAKASTTPSKADDKTSIQAAINWLRGNIGGFTGEDQINAYLELASLLGQLKTLAPTVKKKALASKAGKISARGEAAGLLAQLGTDPFAPALPQTLSAAQAHLAAVKRTLTPEIRAIDKELGDNTLSAKTLAVLRAQMGQYKHTISKALADVKAAIENQKAGFQAAWQKIADAALTAFDSETAAHVSPARLLLNQITEAHDEQALQDALTAANKQLADAMRGQLEDPQGVVQRAREYVGKAILSNAVDAAQATVLGGAASPISSTKLLSDLQQLLVQNTVVDQDAVTSAQKQVDEAQYQIRVHDLGLQADAQDTAWDAERAALRTHLTDLQGDWETYFGILKGNIAAVPGWWVAALNAMGLSGVASSVAGDTAAGGSPGLALQNAHQQALSGAISKAQYQYLISGHKLEIPGFAAGGDFMVDSPTVFAAGEAGREHVQITPARAGTGSGRGGDVIVNVDVADGMEWLKDFINVRVQKQVPEIARSTGRLANTRARSRRF